MSNLREKWLNVMDECGHIVKDGYNDFHRYKYATAAGVLGAVNAALVKNKISTSTESKLLDLRDVSLAGKDKTERLATVEVTVTLYDSESDETMKFSGIGGGQDAGDKAVMKAQTAAIKYAFMMSLAISTDDDPEQDKGTEAYTSSHEYQSGREVSSAGNGKRIVGTCEDCGSDVNEKSAYYSRKNFDGALLCYNCQQKRKSK